MTLDELAKHLASPERIGLTADLATKIGVVDADATRGRLLAQKEGTRGHLQVRLLGCFVVDDTDFFGDGEIYWWSIPAVVDQEGKVKRDPLVGLPSGMPPHACGDQEWMTNLSLGDPPLLAVIPPGDGAAKCVVRLGIYDDDRDPADVPGALTAGLEAYAALSAGPLDGADPVINPVRDAIYQHLKAEDDDILVDQNIVIRRGEVVRFNAGMVGSVINSMARAYYAVIDTERTRRFGPVTLHKGQTELVRFDVPIAAGGRLAVFARGHDVSCPSFGDLTFDQPFVNRVVSRSKEPELHNGFPVIGTGPAKLVAYYTPSYAAEAIE